MQQSKKPSNQLITSEGEEMEIVEDEDEKLMKNAAEAELKRS